MANCDVCNLVKDENNHYLLLDSKYWKVYLADQQDYPGRCFVPLKRHAGDIGELTLEEWQDFKFVISSIEEIHRQYLGASHLNFSLLLNGAYNADEVNPHVHFHVIPRYPQKVEFGGMTFEDTNYGTNYRIDNQWSLNEEGREEILNLIGNKIQDKYMEVSK